jgi:hypothetical protein
VQPIDTIKLRRFALFIGFISITYSFAGIEIDTPSKIQPLGIPLVIKRPDYLPIGLALASLYCVLRYLYFGYFVQISPTRARRMLKKGSPVHAPTLGISLEDFTEHIANEVERYFPSIGKVEASYETSQSGGQCNVTIKIPRIVKVLSFAEDVDYALPVIVNIVAWSIWLIYQIYLKFG